MLFQGTGLIFLSDCLKNVNVVDGVRGSVCFEAKLPPSRECEAAASLFAVLHVFPLLVEELKKKRKQGEVHFCASDPTVLHGVSI